MESEIKALTERLDNCDGKDCGCNASYSGECTCDADWTTWEEIELMIKVAKRDAALIKARDALQLCRPEHVTRPAIKAINEVLK